MKNIYKNTVVFVPVRQKKVKLIKTAQNVSVMEDNHGLGKTT